ncbi:MAG: SgcJ/EcaC family oxidoreductase [Candidatus Kapaibacterium sp.]
MQPATNSSEPTTGTTHANDIRALHHALLDAWNRRSAGDMAALFTGNGISIGFDGSMMSGAAEIESTISGIFSGHQTALYVGIVRSISFPTPGVALLLAVVGMVPPGGTDIKPEVNAIQSVMAVEEKGAWRIALLQNTPAAFHGRPEAAEALTDELRRAYHSHSV